MCKVKIEEPELYILCILFSFNDYVTGAFFTKIVCERYEDTMQRRYIYKRARKIKIIFLILDL